MLYGASSLSVLIVMIIRDLVMEQHRMPFYTVRYLLVKIKYFKLMMTMIYFFSNIHDDDDVNANLHLAGDDLNAATQPAPLFIRETSANGSGPERENPQGLSLTFYLKLS